MRDRDGDTEIKNESLQPLNPFCWPEGENGRHLRGKQIPGRIRLIALGVTPTRLPVQMTLASGTWGTEAKPRGSWEVGGLSGILLSI